MLLSQDYMSHAVDHYGHIIVADSVDLAAQRRLLSGMALGEYKCCRCGMHLRRGRPRDPRRCRNRCGEWLTLEAVDQHLFAAILVVPKWEPRQDAPRCAVCSTKMYALLGEPFHLCSAHGVWFDKDERRSFARLLRSEINTYRAARGRPFGMSFSFGRQAWIGWLRFIVRFTRKWIFRRTTEGAKITAQRTT
jgi:hypothetical protein